MAEQLENIPTLTQVIEQGDENMRGHFDTKNLDQAETPHNITLENASDFENIKPEEMPSIRIDEADQTPQTNLSTAMQDRLDEIQDELPDNFTLDSHKLRQHIDEAISQALPEIEARLKETLYRKLRIK